MQRPSVKNEYEQAPFETPHAANNENNIVGGIKFAFCCFEKPGMIPEILNPGDRNFTEWQKWNLSSEMPQLSSKALATYSRYGFSF